MNWNNWPDFDDRAAMLDGAPPELLTDDEKARIAAIVACLCGRDNHPLPDWVHGLKARAPGGVCLISDRAHRNRWRWPSAFSRHVKRSTPEAARPYRVWFEAETLEKR